MFPTKYKYRPDFAPNLININIKENQTNQKMSTAIYSHGHHESVLRSHKSRTVENSMQFMVPSLKPDFVVLDVGCGPGTITNDLAKNYITKGKVIGLEYEGSVLEDARKDAQEAGITNVEYVTGDIHKLQFDDNTFDLVFAHQVLQHIGDPVKALSEMKRVCKSNGGIVAARDADYGGFVWCPDSEGMSKWGRVYEANARKNGGEPNAGRYLHKWARLAGLEKSQVQCSSSTWCYATPDKIQWWGNLWADRTMQSKFKETSLKNGVATTQELEEISRAWKNWVNEEDAWFSLVHGEILYTKP